MSAGSFHTCLGRQLGSGECSYCGGLAGEPGKVHGCIEGSPPHPTPRVGLEPLRKFSGLLPARPFMLTC